MSASNGDYRSLAFRQKVIANIEEALKKSVNMMGPQRSEKSATDIEQQIFDRSATRDDYMYIVARTILHLQSAHRSDNHLLPKVLVQPSPMASMSTPSPEIPFYCLPSPVPAQPVKQAKALVSRTVQVSSNTVYPSRPLITIILPPATPAGHSLAPVSSPAQFSAQSPSSLRTSRISGIPSVPSVESPGSFNPPSNLGSQESPSKTELSDKEEQLYTQKLKQLSVYTEPLRKIIAKFENEEDVANKDSKNLARLKTLLSILGNRNERVPYQALLKVEDVLRRKLPDSYMSTVGKTMLPPQSDDAESESDSEASDNAESESDSEASDNADSGSDSEASNTNTQNEQQMRSAVGNAALSPFCTTKRKISAPQERCLDMLKKRHEAKMALLELKKSNLLNKHKRKIEVLDAELEYWKNRTKAMKTRQERQPRPSTR